MGHFQNNKEQNRQSSTEIESIDGKKKRDGVNCKYENANKI